MQPGVNRSKGGLQFMVQIAGKQVQNGANLPAEFQKRRGYGIMPWLPVLTGQVVKSDRQVNNSFQAYTE
jgi:hypothetical protein